MRGRALLLSATIALVAAGASDAARAQGNSFGEASARFREGVALSDAGDEPGALAKFQQAWALFKSPPVLFNLARSEQKNGRYLEALEHFREFRDAADDPKITDASRKKAAEYIEEIKTKVGQILIIAPQGTVVTYDGKTLADLRAVAVLPGTEHKIEARLEGRAFSAVLQVDAGRTADVHVRFADEPAVPAAATAAPARALRPDVGTGGERSRMSIIVPVVLGGVGLVGLGLGVGYAVRSRDAKDREDEYRAKYPGACGDPGIRVACDTIKASGAVIDETALLSKISYIGGAAFLVGAVASFLLWPSAGPTTPRVGVTPVAGGTMLSVGVVR